MSVASKIESYRNPSASLISSPKYDVKQVNSIFGAEAVQLFGIAPQGHTYATYHLQAIVDAEPTVYHLDVDFKDDFCSRYRIRGQKVTAKWMDVESGARAR